MKRVLVLGAGLVAKPLVRYLLEKHYEVACASRTVAKAERLEERTGLCGSLMRRGLRRTLRYSCRKLGTGDESLARRHRTLIRDALLLRG